MGICYCCEKKHHYHEEGGVLEVMLNPNPLLLPKHSQPLHIAESREEIQLLKACQSGDLEKVIDLLDRGTSVHIVDHIDGYTPLHCACDNGRVAQVNSITLEEDPFGHLTTTIYDESIAHEIVNKLLRHQVNCNIQARNGQTALHICVRHCYEEIIKSLVEFGDAKESVFIEDNDGNFPVDLIHEDVGDIKGKRVQDYLLAVQFGQISSADE